MHVSGKPPEPSRLDERIASLLATPYGDHGTYVLALHEIIGKCASASLPEASRGQGFRELLQGYGKLLRRRGRSAGELAALTRIAEEHEIALLAARASLPLEEEEALAATHNFLGFCSLAGIRGAAVAELGRKLASWKKRLPHSDGESGLPRLQSDLSFSQSDREKILAQTESWARDKQRLAELEGETMRLAAAREKETARAGGDEQRLAELSRHMEGIEREKQGLAKQLEGYRDLDLYVHHVSRFSLYTRTRMDYERGVMQLTPEQTEALESIKPGFRFPHPRRCGHGKNDRAPARAGRDQARAGGGAGPAPRHPHPVSHLHDHAREV